MSNISLIIEERAANIGNFLVGRLLPFRKKRSVGPFVFIDHMGPVALEHGQNFDVLPHPHIGLSTLTYLFEGSITHRDSLGSKIEITPGSVNWMTAGKGIVHSERTPDHLRNKSQRLHGLQIWVGLPKELEETEPSFHHIGSKEIPTWTEAGISYKLIAGEAKGKISPVPVHSKLFLIEITNQAKKKVELSEQLFGEVGLYILQGRIKSEGHVFDSKQILVAKDPAICSFELEPDSKIFLFGGQPFPEKRYMDWNFVSTNKDRLKKAKEDWMAQRFPAIPDEKGFVPYPTKSKG
jgi:redox-sensitive bicupin YhaK (pirin superfamily)